jgi:hypothetical protein
MASFKRLSPDRVDSVCCPLNTGECYYFKPPALRDVDALDPHMACEHFNQVHAQSAGPCHRQLVAARHLDQHSTSDDDALCMQTLQAYLDPAEFRVCLTGAVDEEASAAVHLHLLLTGPVKHKVLGCQVAWLFA